MKDGGDKEGFWGLIESSLQYALNFLHSFASLIPSLRISAITAHIPYIVPILDSLTGQSGTVPRVRTFGRERVLQRLKSGTSRKDLFYYLVR
jgi:hypothetical protein